MDHIKWQQKIVTPIFSTSIHALMKVGRVFLCLYQLSSCFPEPLPWSLAIQSQDLHSYLKGFQPRLPNEREEALSPKSNLILNFSI